MRSTFARFPAIALLCLWTCAATLAAAAAGAPATITFRKVFKLSFPEFIEIKITQAGQASADIRQLDEDAAPETFDLSPQLVAKIFQLADQLHDFNGVNLDTHRRIANLGEKTFRYQNGTDTHETHFNFTADPAASQLLDIFEGLARQQNDLSNLSRAMHYDPLGVNDVLERLEADYNNKVFPEPQRLLPPLDQLAANEKFLTIARERARTLANRIRSSAPAAPSAP
jgi:hypothetical protein